MNYWNWACSIYMLRIFQRCHLFVSFLTYSTTQTLKGSNQQTKSKTLQPCQIFIKFSCYRRRDRKREQNRKQKRRKYVLIVWRADNAALMCGRCRITLMSQHLTANTASLPSFSISSLRELDNGSFKTKRDQVAVL